MPVTDDKLPPIVLIVGNFTSNVTGIRGVCEDLSDHLETRGWRIFRTSSKSGRLNRLIDIVRTLVTKAPFYHVAAVEVYSGRAFFLAEITVLLLRFLKKPFVLTLHGGNLPNFSRRWQWRVRSLLNAAALVTTPSRYLASELAWLHSEIMIIPNAISLEMYPFKERQQVAPQLVWLRAFHTIYNPVLAAKVLAQLADEFPQLQLTMFGPDKGDGSLQQLQSSAQQLDVLGRLSFPGAVPKAEVPQKLAPFDIFINTTNVESFGVSIIEAAALGMCIVTTSVGELPYIWTHEHDALLVPPDDPQAMADAIRRILTEPGLAEQLSRNARTTAEQYDWSILLPRWETLFYDMIEQRRAKA